MTFRRRDPIADPLLDSDKFSVARETRDGVTAFLVTHYPTAYAKHPCCEVRVDQQPGESETATLTRAAVAIEAKHA